MKLFYRNFGQGKPIIIIHGLYGSSDNWVGIGRKLAQNFEIFLVDQRNHGNSPHSNEHNYDLLQNDILEFMNDHNIEKATIIGHSMGGKTAIFFAKNNPERTSNLIIVDIAPINYSIKNNPHFINHKAIIETMLSVDFDKIKSRKEADNALKSNIPSIALRQFLLKNIKKNNDNSFSWRINIRSIYNNLEQILKADINKDLKITGFPILFIRGENSEYLTKKHYQDIYTMFPSAKIVTIKDSGHWLHAENPNDFIEEVQKFLFNQ